jgi:hypothetical protein
MAIKYDTILGTLVTTESGSDIKELYEAEANTNAYTDAEKTKLGNMTDAYKGHYATEAALILAHPTPSAGSYATVEFTDTVWLWDNDGSAWTNTGVLSMGDMLKGVYDPTNISSDAFSMANMVETATEVVMTDVERAKLTGIEASATADQTAVEVPNTPAGNIASTDVQSAINELDVNVDDRLKWIYPPLALGSQYSKNNVTKDGDWSMVCNTDTTDRPAPQPSGAPEDALPTTELFSEGLFTGVVHSGSTFTFLQSGWIDTVSVYVPDIDSAINYRIITEDITNPSEPIVTVKTAPLLIANGWADVAIGKQFIEVGSVFRVTIDALNLSGITTVTGGWGYGGFNVGIPTVATWNRDNKHTILNIDITDLDTTDRHTELLGMTAGTNIDFVQTDDSTKSFSYEVLSVVDNTTYLTYNVILTGTGTNGGVDLSAVSTMTGEIPISSPTKYSNQSAYYTANQPTFATVTGYLTQDGLVIGGADDVLYGVNINFQQAYVSDDWDIIAVDGGTSSGGSVGDSPAVISASQTASVSATDTTPAFLDDKIVAGAGIIKTTLNPSGNEQSEIKMGPHYLSLASTGLISGAVLTVGTTIGTFDISAGEGVYVDSTTSFPTVDAQGVVITARTNVPVTNILTQEVTYILVDKNDAIIQSTTFPTAVQRRDSIFVGVLAHGDHINVDLGQGTPSVSNNISAQLHDLMLSLGLFNISGNVISQNGSLLSLNKSLGYLFKAGGNYDTDLKNPHILEMVAQVAVTFNYLNQDSSGSAPLTAIDPTTWDDGGVTTTIPNNNNATIQQVYLFSSGVILLQRGQEVFSTYGDALEAVGSQAFVVEPNIALNGLLIAEIVLKKGTTDLTNSADASIFITNRFGETGSVGSSAVGTLQDGYNNSVEPEILTNDVLGALSLKRGSTGGDTDNVFEVVNGSDVVTVQIDGVGNVTANSLTGDGSGLTGISAGTDNNQTGTAYTLVLADQENTTVFMNNVAVNTVTIPLNASVAFAISTKASIIREGAGVTVIQADVGVILNGVSGGSVLINTQFQGAAIMKRGTDTWLVTGDIS